MSPQCNILWEHFDKPAWYLLCQRMEVNCFTNVENNDSAYAAVREMGVEADLKQKRKTHCYFSPPWCAAFRTNVHPVHSSLITVKFYNYSLIISGSFGKCFCCHLSFHNFTNLLITRLHPNLPLINFPLFASPSNWAFYISAAKTFAPLVFLPVILALLPWFPFLAATIFDSIRLRLWHNVVGIRMHCHGI